ncbi:hypothetical protein BAUCODRAFT_562996 [Baudoinia panamericana UAMH 10762]|uniref:Uncharacterized protein n=1 Tax=Baudoinia panamericana (strain UAMH 10762) TaxID=717646 RepID=M2ME17_BAUPA|nr:uncharacterized protein BAUCODRAFT_562996 [Baudoinia panamericana UAMH 10762]EMC94821.1 hypothetical protein BAUCODRAFT_562996 [Baudoinia panamericana UAMH 10762]
MIDKSGLVAVDMRIPGSKRTNWGRGSCIHAALAPGATQIWASGCSAPLWSPFDSARSGRVGALSCRPHVSDAAAPLTLLCTRGPIDAVKDRSRRPNDRHRYGLKSGTLRRQCINSHSSRAGIGGLGSLPTILASMYLYTRRYRVSRVKLFRKQIDPAFDI